MNDGRRYKRVYADEWHEPAFRRLNAAARVVRFYVTAGPQTTSVGCFRLSTAVAVEDLGGTAEDFERDLEAVCSAFCWAWDPLARVVWIADWLEKNAPANPNVVASWAKLMKNVPDCDVKTHAVQSIAQSLKSLPASFREPWAELSRSFRKADGFGELRTETIQGAESREQFSGNREQATGREANDHSKVSDAVHTIARRAVIFCGVHEQPSEIESVFWNFWNSERSGQQAKRDDVKEAITLALSEQRGRPQFGGGAR